MLMVVFITITHWQFNNNPLTPYNTTSSGYSYIRTF